MLEGALSRSYVSEAELQRRSSVLTILLLVMAASLVVLSGYNLYAGEIFFLWINVAFLGAIAGLLILNHRLGWVRLSAVLTVILTTGGSLSLIETSVGSTYISMTVPVFISSYLIVPAAGLVVAAAISAAAVSLGVSPLPLIVLGVEAVFFYLLTGSLHRAYEYSHYQAHHDSLTGLPNRSSFNEYLRIALKSAQKSRRLVAVLFMDLDNFKLINDSLGHQYGDRLLQDVAVRLKRCLRTGDVAARLGGDEFILLLRELDDPADAVTIAGRVAEEFKEPFDLFGQEVTMTICTGIATYGHPLSDNSSDSAPEVYVEDPQYLLRSADLALYQAKLRKDDYKVFTQDMHSGAVKRLELERELRNAIENDEFQVYYQPTFSLTSRRLQGVEALVRWGSEQRGLMMPSEFIPVAEETGLIVPIGERIIKEACSRAGSWYAGYESFRRCTLSLNLSARQFADPRLANAISRLLESYVLPPGNVQLEVTESMLMDDHEKSIERLQAFKAMGLKIAIDDFGKAYSSLTYIRELPVDTLKVEQSFVAGMTKNTTDLAIVRLVIQLAHELGLEVVAEGAETEEQLTQLTALGCDVAQGFYFSKPLPSGELEYLLRGHSEARGTLRSTAHDDAANDPTDDPR